MLSYYRNTIIKLVSKLRFLEQDTNNLNLLVELQEEISKKIIYIEGRIGKCKEQVGNLKKAKNRKRLPKGESLELKEQMRTVRERIVEYQWILFIFRTLGDGIAFLYLDKWDIKPLAYKSDSPDFKENPGHISGKSGMKSERLMVSVGADLEVPALRTDLTNSIRYGDICFLIGPKPRLIEIKSSYNQNARVRRQVEELIKIQGYLDNDYAVGLRGFSAVRRVDVRTAEVTYVKYLNELIDEALQKIYAYREVEPGVIYYVQIADTKPQFQDFAERLHNPIFYYLNTYKNESDWINYYPFTLSIRRPENVYLFLRGQIQIIVFVDIPAIQTIAREQGFETDIHNDSKWIFEFNKISSTGERTFCKVSRHYLNRVAFEFSSLRWLLSQALLNPTFEEFKERI